MFSHVVEHVSQSISHLARRLQDVDVKSLTKNLAGSTNHSVDGPRYPDGEPLHPQGEGGRVLGLHDEVEVVRLDGELDEAETEAVLTRDQTAA